MAHDTMPFILVPLLVYTYFWLNPFSLHTFMEGLLRTLVELYLGYKEWLIEFNTWKHYLVYKKQSARLARQEGFSSVVLSLYFEEFGQKDRQFIRQQQKALYEERHRELEDELRQILLK